jgi:hypothetical protein
MPREKAAFVASRWLRLMPPSLASTSSSQNIHMQFYFWANVPSFLSSKRMSCDMRNELLARREEGVSRAGAKAKYWVPSGVLFFIGQQRSGYTCCQLETRLSAEDHPLGSLHHQPSLSSHFAPLTCFYLGSTGDQRNHGRCSNRAEESSSSSFGVCVLSCRVFGIRRKYL